MPPPCCPSCQEERDFQFRLVREVVRECPGITALQVSYATEVPLEVILKFVESRKIEVVPLKDVEDNRERDGIYIKTAKRIRDVYMKTESASPGQVPTVDELRESTEKEKFTWHKE
jgi:hypothetical protein